MSNKRNPYWREYAKRPDVREKRKAYMEEYKKRPEFPFRRKLHGNKISRDEIKRAMAQFMELQL